CCVPRNSPCPLHHARSTQLSWWSRVPLPSVFLLEKGASSSTPLSVVSGSVWLEAEVEPGACLEHQAPFLPVALATNDDERGGEADDLEVIGQLRRAPNLTVLGFQILPGAGPGVDLGEQLAADVFGWVGHRSFFQDTGMLISRWSRWCQPPRPDRVSSSVQRRHFTTN